MTKAMGMDCRFYPDLRPSEYPDGTAATFDRTRQCSAARSPYLPKREAPRLPTCKLLILRSPLTLLTCRSIAYVGSRKTAGVPSLKNSFAGTTEAVMRAKRFVQDLDIEVWADSRFVFRLECKRR
jgi:hypothetical protein